MNFNNCACVRMWWCMCVQHVMHGMAWHWGTKRKKCEKHTNTDQNMINMISQDKIQALELTWVQFNTKMSLGHFVKHLTSNKVPKWCKLHEHNEIFLNTCSNCHKGPTQEQSQQMGLSPIKDFEIFLQKLRTPTHFRKIPNFWTLT